MFLWFGDSFTIGHELHLSTGRIFEPLEFAPNAVRDTDPLSAYPALVSEHFDEQHYNYAICGGSVHFALYELTKIYKNKKHLNEENVTVFLSHTGELRRFGIDLNGEHVPTGAGEQFILDQEPRSEYKNRDNFCLYDYTIAFNNFYVLTKLLNWNFYHYPIWGYLNLLDDICIAPYDRLLTSTILCQYGDYTDEGTGHPNVEGHKVMANTIIKLLEDKNVNIR